MIVLTALRGALKADTSVSAAAAGGIHLLDIPQDSVRPNIMLMTVTGSDDWTHSGADGLHRDIVRIYSRGDTVQSAIELALLARAALNGLITSAYYGVSIQLTQHINTTGDYQDGAEVFRQIDDYRVQYRLG